MRAIKNIFPYVKLETVKKLQNAVTFVLGKIFTQFKVQKA